MISIFKEVDYEHEEKIIIPIILILLIWTNIAYADYRQVGINWERPIFCSLVGYGAEDGGSGKYVGLGYSFNIEGNFVTEDGYRGVEKYTFKVLEIITKEDEIHH